ncbi:MAG: DinB family protein, partial [Anaerolineales bacterium]
MNKTEFLNTLRAERKRFDDRLAGLSEEQLARRASPEAWSIKDNLAHLTNCEQYMLNNIRRALERGEAPRWMNDEEETRSNAQIWTDNRDRPLAEVLADMRRSLSDVINLVESFSEADLTDPNRFDWLKG